jgi:eukaryotic-like serine/threonine-protein kinase
LPEHQALGPLNEVLVWAAAPDPAERLDASSLGRRLESLAADLPVPAPLPIVDPLPSGPLDEVERAMVRPARRSAGDPDERDLTELGAPALLAARPKGTKAGSAVAVGSARVRRRWPWIAAIGVLVAALVAAGVVIAAENKVFVASHPVPLLVGKSLAEAQRSVRADHFAVRPTGHDYSISLAAGLILRQHPVPTAGHRPVTAKEGSAIDVVLSSGPPPVTIPSLTSLTNCTQAVEALSHVHLIGVCPASAAQYSSTVVAGAVLATTPAGTATYGSTVTIITSKGHAPVSIPVVTGPTSTYATAASALTAAGFVPAQAKAYSPTVPVGQVVGTSPDPSTGPRPFGSTVTVSVSLGPQPVTIPDEVGRSVSAATTAFETLGLHVAGPYGPAGSTTVLSTDPAAGASVAPGTTVNVYTL